MSSETSNSQKYDVLVVGLGGVGSAAGYYLAQAGKRVLMAEQFEIGHVRGSSHGGSRIFRHSHDTATYGSLIPHAYELWQRLEAESGKELLKITGGLDMGPQNDPYVSSCVTAMDELGFEYEQLTGSEVRARFPQFRIPDEWMALHQAEAGILAASRCVRTMADEARRHGATLRIHTRVEDLRADGEGIQACLHGPVGKETVYADQAIITAGPWAPQFLSELCGRSFPLRVTHQQVAYFRVTKPELFDADRCPVYIFTAAPHFYGFPAWEKPGYVKMAKEFSDETDPNGGRVVDEEKLQELSDAVTSLVGDVEPTPIDGQVCLYTETPSRDFIIDRHPAHPQIIFGAGFSGRGFKFVIASGRLLADLALSDPGEYRSPLWRENFRIENFVASVGA